MDKDDESRRAAAAIRLLTALGDPFHRPRPRKRGPVVPAEFDVKCKEFWSSQSCSAYALEKDSTIKLDPTLVLTVPKSNAAFQCEGWTFFPISQQYVCGVDPPAVGGDREMEKIVWSKLRSLGAVESGPNWYDRLLMTVRSLAATTTAQRGRLLYTQVREFQRNYLLRYGPPLGRYYFTCDTLGEVRKALRSLPLLSTIRTLMRWMSGRV